MQMTAEFFKNFSKTDLKSRLIYFILFQMECCGVHNYKDFNKALEFKKYTNEEGDGQIIPEACCMLSDNNNRNAEQLAKLLFEPKDPNCVSVPTVTNSYMNQVIFYRLIFIKGSHSFINYPKI